MTTIEKNTYVYDVRTQAANILLILNKLHGLLEKWNALDLANSLDDADLIGDNDGQHVADIAAVIGTTLTAFDGLLDAGHATNLHKIAVV